MEAGQKGKGKSSDRRAKIPVKTFPIKKRINTELFIHVKGKLYRKVKAGSDQEISDLLEEGRILAGIKEIE